MNKKERQEEEEVKSQNTAGNTAETVTLQEVFEIELLRNEISWK